MSRVAPAKTAEFAVDSNRWSSQNKVAFFFNYLQRQGVTIKYPYAGALSVRFLSVIIIYFMQVFVTSSKCQYTINDAIGKSPYLLVNA